MLAMDILFIDNVETKVYCRYIYNTSHTWNAYALYIQTNSQHFPDFQLCIFKFI